MSKITIPPVLLHLAVVGSGSGPRRAVCAQLQQTFASFAQVRPRMLPVLKNPRGHSSRSHASASRALRAARCTDLTDTYGKEGAVVGSEHRRSYLPTGHAQGWDNIIKGGDKFHAKSGVREGHGPCAAASYITSRQPSYAGHYKTRRRE